MKFDRFLAKLFSKRIMIPLIAMLLLALILSSCRFTEEDCMMCFFCGIVTPETCFSWCFDCLDCSDKICADCLEECFGCENVGQCHNIECAAKLDESCIGQTTVHIFDCINEYCEDCEACQECY